MQKRRIIEAINKYYHQEVITDIRFIMKRQSYVKVENKTSLIRFLMNRLLQNVLIFLDIVLSKEDVDAIDTSLKQTDNEALKLLSESTDYGSKARNLFRAAAWIPSL